MISRSAAETVEQLIARVRREVDDPSTDGAGNIIPTPSRRFNDEEILSAVNDTLIWMGTIMSLNHPGEALIYTDHVYIEDTGDVGDLLPAGIDANGILRVEDISTPSFPAEVFYLHNLDEAKLPARDNATLATGPFRRFYTLAADADSTAYRIKIRPIPSGLTFRIHHVATPFVVEVDSDQPLLSARWRQLIGLESAVNLLAPSDAIPDSLNERAGRERALFLLYSSRQKNPEHVRLARRPF